MSDPLIPIPIGIRQIAAVQGTVWKFVSCARCQQRYAYLLELEATGEALDLPFMDGRESAERARAQAEQNLALKCRNVVFAVPCSTCAFYQDDMSRQLKEEASINALQIAGLVIAVLSLIPLAFGIPFIWILTIVMAVAGLTLMVWGYVLALRFDPNAGDPEPRKALGRMYSVSGKQLAEMLSASPPAESNAADAP